MALKGAWSPKASAFVDIAKAEALKSSIHLKAEALNSKKYADKITDDYLYNHIRIKDNNLSVSTGLAR